MGYMRFRYYGCITVIFTVIEDGYLMICFILFNVFIIVVIQGDIVLYIYCEVISVCIMDKIIILQNQRIYFWNIIILFKDPVLSNNKTTVWYAIMSNYTWFLV